MNWPLLITLTVTCLFISAMCGSFRRHEEQSRAREEKRQVKLGPRGGG